MFIQKQAVQLLLMMLQMKWYISGVTAISMTEKVCIYIPLLGEGVPVLRPTLGQVIKDDIFKVLPTEDYDPEDEHWQFPPGKIVRCIRKIRDGNEILVATAEYPEML